MQKRHHYLGAITGGDVQASTLCSAIVAGGPSDVRVSRCAGGESEARQFARRRHLSGLQCSSLRATAAAARINTIIVCPRMTIDLHGAFHALMQNIAIKHTTCPGATVQVLLLFLGSYLIKCRCPMPI